MRTITQINVKEIIQNVFLESGIILECEKDGDCDLSGYLEDSLHFISMIVSIEEKMKVEFPDELLTLEAFQSLNALSNALLEKISSENFDIS